MAIDPRSLERLRELGRRLPERLPPPQPSPLPDPQPAHAERQRQPGRHPLETETDPEQLFRELIAASPDGHVPPHLLDRLRTLEAPGRAPAAEPASNNPSPPAPPGRRQRRRRPGGAGTQAATADADLYSAFALLLREQDDAEGD